MSGAGVVQVAGTCCYRWRGDLDQVERDNLDGCGKEVVQRRFNGRVTLKAAPGQDPGTGGSPAKLCKHSGASTPILSQKGDLTK